MQPEKPNYAALLLIGICGYWLFSSMSGPTPEPVGPQPVPVVASEHLTATLEFGAALQQHITDTIGKLESGELTTDVATRDWLKVGREAALKAAWMPVAEKDVAAFADGWTVEKQIARLKELIAPGVD